MVNEQAAFEIEALCAVDQRQLFLILGKAIDEEVAAGMGGDRISHWSERDRMRLGFLCMLTGRIRDVNTCTAAGRVKRKAEPSPKADSGPDPVSDHRDFPVEGLWEERQGL